MAIDQPVRTATQSSGPRPTTRKTRASKRASLGARVPQPASALTPAIESPHVAAVEVRARSIMRNYEASLRSAATRTNGGSPYERVMASWRVTCCRSSTRSPSTEPRFHLRGRYVQRSRGGRLRRGLRHPLRHRQGGSQNRCFEDPGGGGQAPQDPPGSCRRDPGPHRLHRFGRAQPRAVAPAGRHREGLPVALRHRGRPSDHRRLRRVQAGGRQRNRGRARPQPGVELHRLGG